MGWWWMEYPRYEHSGRHGFEPVGADPTVATPPKATVCSMLRRETELRNATSTQV